MVRNMILLILWKKLFVMFFLLKIEHYNIINKHYHYFLMYLLIKSFLPQGNIVPQWTN